MQIYKFRRKLAAIYRDIEESALKPVQMRHHKFFYEGDDYGYDFKQRAENSGVP